MENENITLGSIIKNRRTELNLGQRELARLVGLNHATISRLENDPSAVADIKTIKSIATALNLDENYLLALNKDIDLDEDICLIARASKQMSADRREKMMNYLKKTFKKEFQIAENNKGGNNQ